MGAAAIGAGSEFGLEIDVAGFGGNLEFVWANPIRPRQPANPAAINPATEIRPCAWHMVLLGRGRAIAGSLKRSIGSEYACP